MGIGVVTRDHRKISEGIALLGKTLLAYTVLIALLPACFASGEPPPENGDSQLLSNLYMWQGQQHLKQGRSDLAAEAFVKAADYMRTSPYPHFMLARLHLRRSLMDAFLEFATGLKLLMADFAGQSLVLSNLILAVFLAVGIAAYVAAIVILVRHARTVWLSLLLTFSPMFGEKHLRVLMALAVVTFLVMLSGLSLLAVLTWAIVIGSGLIWRYASASERRMTIGFLVYLVAFVPFFDTTMRVASTQHPSSPTKIAALAGQKSESEFARVARTNEVLSENNPIGEFMRGLLCLRTGDPESAIEHFNLASKLVPNNVATLNNIGVALHNLGRYREAQAKFEEALRKGSKTALIHYNYSQTLNALLLYDVAQNELARASALDFDLVRSLVTSTDKPHLVPMNLDNAVLWGLAMHPSNELLASGYHPTESAWPGLLLLAALTAAAFMLARKAQLPARCDVCETLVKVRVTKRKRREFLCPDCKAIKQANADDNDAIEKQMENRVGRLETRRGIAHLVLGLVVPGSTYHLLGSKVTGFVLSVVVFTAFVAMVGGGGPIGRSPHIGAERSYPWAVILFGIVYGLYAWRSVMLVLRTPGEE
jgi:tetratricopeptide (TPR) repeat protein